MAESVDCEGDFAFVEEDRDSVIVFFFLLNSSSMAVSIKGASAGAKLQSGEDVKP